MVVVRVSTPLSEVAHNPRQPPFLNEDIDSAPSANRQRLHNHIQKPDVNGAKRCGKV